MKAVSGARMARLLTDSGMEVTVVEARQEIAGNCFDENKGGVVLHAYGPHLLQLGIKNSPCGPRQRHAVLHESHRCIPCTPGTYKIAARHFHGVST